MPLTYSVAYGLIGGIGTYIALHLWAWALQGFQRLRNGSKPASNSPQSPPEPAKASNLEMEAMH